MSDTSGGGGRFDPREITLTGVSRARVSTDGADVAVAFRDATGDDHGFLLSFEDLSRTMVQLLAVQRTAGERRRARELPDSPAAETVERDLLLPFPVARWEVGWTREKGRLILRLTSDNALVWDFLLPGEMAGRLIEDLERTRALAAERGDGGTG